MRKVIQPHLGQGIKGKAVSGSQGELKRDSWEKDGLQLPSLHQGSAFMTGHRDSVLYFMNESSIPY